MIRYRFTDEDLLRTRFAISPLFEATSAIAVLRDPARHSIHLPWVRATRERAGALDLSLLEPLIPRRGYTPDFISPPPESPVPDVEAEIDRVRRTAAADARRELALRFDAEPMPLAFRQPPRSWLPELARQLAAFWAVAIEPVWERVLSVLEDDIAHRARRLTSGGAIDVFAGLHPDVAWSDGALNVRPAGLYEADVLLGGRGLQLVPAAFIWPRVGAMIDPPWQPALVYPPRGVGDLWAPRPRDDGALARLLGPRRARLLADLDREATTTALARRTGASAPSVSEHLAVLRGAGLVRSRRQGREVLYARTAAGDALLRAPATAPGSRA